MTRHPGCRVGPLHRRALTTAAAVLAAAALGAQGPVIEKVEPPEWWIGHSINPVRVMVRGRALDGARFTCGRLRCGRATTSASGTTSFVDVTVPPGLAPGTYPITVQTAAGRRSFDFTVARRLATGGRFGGVGPDDVLYLAMPDRFANGDPGNDDPPKAAGLHDRAKARSYHGGDLAGLQRRLPYLKALGITAIWINPIYDNDDRVNGSEVAAGEAATAYHGYHTRDYYGVDEHFGDTATFRAFVDAAHAQGIKVVLDMVANHTGPGHPWVADPPTPTWFNGTKAAHLANVWQTWTLADPHATPAMRRSTLDGWFVDLLPDLNQDDPETRRYLIQNTLWWVEKFGLDGIRQDTWPYVPRTFWRDWMAAIKAARPGVTVVGEVFEGDPSLVSFFEGGRRQWDGIDTGVDQLFDFPLFFASRSAFARGKAVREVAQTLGRDHLYRDASRLVTFLGLHDVDRFMHEPGATPEGLMLAFTFQLTTRGIPLVYYGDEIAMPGGGDPDNRRDFPGGWSGDARDAFTEAGRTPTEQRVFAHVRAVLALRATRPDLRRAPLELVANEEQQLAYRRGASVIVLNNATTEARVRLAVRAPLAAAVIGGCGAPVRDGDALVVTVPPRTGCVF